MKFTKMPFKNCKINDKLTVKKGYKYQVTEANTIIGEMVVDNDLRIWLLHNNSCLHMNSYSVKLPPHIIDISNNEVKGSYYIKKFKSSGYAPEIMAATLGETSYTLTSIDTDTKFNLVKPSTWGQFKFVFTNGDKNAIFSFDIPQSFFSVINHNPYINREFEGVIENEGLSSLEIMLGVAMVEKALYRIPPDNSQATAGI
ncbi:MAG: hypothetical protein ACOVQE_00475 [Chitinophagaceae bacterium]